MEKLSMEKTQFEKVASPYNLDSLKNLNWEIMDAVDEVEDEVYEMPQRDEAFKKKLAESRSAVAEKYIQKLKIEADRFSHIFETEKGSTYFITQNGESLRFKNTEKGLSRQPIMLKTFFIDQEMLDEINQEYKRVGDLCSFAGKNTIRITKLQLGVYPLELDSATALNGGEVLYTANEDTLKINGMNIDRNGKTYLVGPAGGFIYHLGHKVIKIIK